MNAQYTPSVAQYLRYVDWARRSGYEPICWLEYKVLRSRPAVRYGIAKAIGSAS